MLQSSTFCARSKLARRHVPSRTINGGSCTSCFRSFAAKAAWARHLKSNHLTMLKVIEMFTQDATLLQTMEKLMVLHDAGACPTEIVGLDYMFDYLVVKQPLGRHLTEILKQIVKQR
jgi:hypothetical protein